MRSRSIKAGGLLCSAVFLGACASSPSPTIAARFADAFVLLPGAGFRYSAARRCFIKSANWGSYCLKVSGEREIPTPGGKMKLFQLDGVPLLDQQSAVSAALPHAIALVAFKEIGGYRWQLQNDDARLYTVTAPAKIGVPRFTDLGGGHYGFIQRLFFVDTHNIYREKALISYLDDRKTHYLNITTALNDSHANVFKDTRCDYSNKDHHSAYCRGKITIVGSAIGFKPSARTRDGFRPITVDCRGTHLGRPTNCTYELVYQKQKKRYAVERPVAIFGDPLTE